LDHHDAFDSKPSQSKGFSVGEVKQYRAELRNAVQRMTEEEVHLGGVPLANRDPFAGHYVRDESDLSWAAELDVTVIPDTKFGAIRYFVSGFAITGGHRPQGPAMGMLEFAAELADGYLRHTFYVGDERDAHPHKVEIKFGEDTLELTEINEIGSYGWGVSFAGDYKRAPKLNFSEMSWANEEAKTLFRDADPSA
jgi:hypothetical protein